MQLVIPSPHCGCSHHWCTWCNPNLHPAHPSTNCSCCIVSWEATDRSMTFSDFISGSVQQLPKPNASKSLAAQPANLAKDFNVIIGTNNFLFDSDSDFLFGTEPFHQFDSAISFADLLVHFGFFPSKGQARRNGWDRPIPDGWSEFVIGKLKNRLFIWNPKEPS